MSHTVEVPGARLYYEVQGSGPVLAVIGHPMDSSGFAPLVSALTGHYTVVTIDPRGFGRSAIADRNQDAIPEVLADDVKAVLDLVGSEPVHMFGNSGGAVIGLALVAKYPDRLRTLVAHDPPLAELLPDREKARASIHDIYDTYRAHGQGPAWGMFFDFGGFEAPPMPEGEPQEPSAEEVAAGERLFGHALLPITLYEPDIAALRTASTRIVAAGGGDSKGTFPQRAAAALAEQLGTPLVDFPGDHGGFDAQPAEFAQTLHKILS
ncbi:alpha/beta fold hydrolase [Nonomuraea diastatica]|uniref:Alpha/beta hydrolase n=1 Tax=Nonomuraea diastatica TaxID=1848329 RepID=A0A4V2YCC0_9ACTN|nr:alpha/beta hydrolase [Nonomuraea diastatica]TDD10956.1 alpha/beta hydrolase [Nonomuraea diastatica]